MQFTDNAGLDQPAHFAQADLGLHCLLTKSMDTVVYGDREFPDSTDVPADLDLCCLNIMIWHKRAFPTLCVLKFYWLIVNMLYSGFQVGPTFPYFFVLLLFPILWKCPAFPTF